MKKSELPSVTDTNAYSCSSSITNTIQDTFIATQLAEDDKIDDDTINSEVLVKEDKNICESVGNVEVTSISSVEFVDIVSGESNQSNFRFLCTEGYIF